MKNNITVEYVDKLLKEHFPKINNKVVQAMEYSLFGGGKRFRPLLLLVTAKAVNGRVTKGAQHLACALECIHTYSLIHDDLPAMDNDDLRRGKRSCHMQFGEASAVLAGDALLNLAIEIVLNGPMADAKYKKAATFLFQMSGVNGMINGQSLDLFSETNTFDDANAVALHKTGDLLRAAIVCGAYVGGACTEEIPVFDDIAQNFGICYQVVDDLLDKNKIEKSFLDVLSEQGCVNYAKKLTDKVKELCDSLPYDLNFIKEYADKNFTRNY